MVVALRFAASILPQSDLNSSSVKSLVQHLISAALSSSPVPENSGGGGALTTQVFPGDNVRCRVKIALRVATHQLPILGESHVALNDAGTHACGRDVGLLRVLGELQGSAAVAYREVGPLEWALGALLEFGLELTLIHVFDEEFRTRAELNAMAAIPVPSKGISFRGFLTGEREGCHNHQAKDQYPDHRSQLKKFLVLHVSLLFLLKLFS
jgi:hypothetical protein